MNQYYAMESKSYLDRLKTFSSTDKYLLEQNFLFNLMLPIYENENILDYGCGVGTNIRYLQKRTSAQIFGYDIERYIDSDLENNFIYNVKGLYNKIIFQHSIAHIQNIKDVLAKLKENLVEKGEIIIITPNKEFDEYYKKIKNVGYVPDITVKKHYNSQELVELFLSCGYNIKIAGTFGKLIENIHERCFLIAIK
jgi:2-polyprenyl-3-methyl-5-hydroxy-6-metoxy-1,4-benzoquinol methylase